MDFNTQHLLRSMAIVKHQQNRSEQAIDIAKPQKIRIVQWVRARFLWRPKRKRVVEQCECGEQVIRLKKSSQIG